MKKKEHKVQVLMHGTRYVATELNNKITFSKDGTEVGSARWHDGQLVDSSAILPDDVAEALEKKITERMNANWDED